MAGIAIAAGNGVVSTLAGQAVLRLINGNFNPNYSKIDRKKMRYIQQKYCSAYATSLSASEDASDTIKQIGK
jgi:hypothetical protein